MFCNFLTLSPTIFFIVSYNCFSSCYFDDFVFISRELLETETNNKEVKAFLHLTLRALVHTVHVLQIEDQGHYFKIYWH